MSELEKSSVKGKNVIQYASDKINELDDNNPMEGIKKIVAVDRLIREAIRTHEIEQERIVDSNAGKTPSITGNEIKEAVEEGLYR